jgi:hypothetical protein
VDTGDYIPTTSLRHVDDTFVVWRQGTKGLQEFLHYINTSLRPTIQFTIEEETNNILLLIDVLVKKRGSTLVTKVYRKPTHTRRYLHFKSNRPPYVKREVVHVHCLVNQAKVTQHVKNDMI